MLRLALVGLVACRYGFDPAVGDARGSADARTIDAAGCLGPVMTYDPCATLPALAAPPVIDGVLDCGLGLMPITPVGWTGTGTIPSGNSASWIAAWRPDGLYVFIDVTDPDRVLTNNGLTYCGDAIELYVDSDGMYTSPPSYDQTGTVQLVASAPANATMPVTTGDEYQKQTVVTGPWQGQFGVWPTASGYVLEAFIQAPALYLTSWSLAAGQRIGLDAAVDVSGTPIECGTRAGQYFVHVTNAAGGCPGDPYCDVRAFCTPTLQ